MDTRTLFQKISQKMRTDFEISSHINHAVSKGTVRENQLRNFLSEKRLPDKYGLGAGEIVGRIRDTSRQCDVIVYDCLDGIALLSDDSIQVYPVDCVYGIIEVKSSLSKTEFIDSLDKIKAFKMMSPAGKVSTSLGGGFTSFAPRSRPFGMVFAYGLAGNSLDSLVENLKEWESNTPPEFWPNYVCVLEVGTIYHMGNVFEECLDSEKIVKTSWPIGLHFKEDSLFKFYCALYDICSRMKLGPAELTHYYDPPLQIGKYVVHGWGMEGQLANGGGTGKLAHLKETSIDKVVDWCNLAGPLKYRETLLKRFGSVPTGMDDHLSLDRDVYLYNPENLPGLHEIGPTLIQLEGGGVSLSASCLAQCAELNINGALYVVAMESLTSDDYEY